MVDIADQDQVDGMGQANHSASWPEVNGFRRVSRIIARRFWNAGTTDIPTKFSLPNFSPLSLPESDHECASQPTLSAAIFAVDFTFILLCAAGATPPVLSIVAVVADRFNHAMASIAALAAGLPPLLFAFMWNYGSLRGQIIQLFAMLGSGPFFLVSFFLYGVGINRRSGRTLTVPARASLFGFFAGVTYSLLLFDFLSGMP